MPRVRKQSGSEVAPSALPGARLTPTRIEPFNANVTPASQGAAIGEGLFRAGQVGLEIDRRERIRQDEVRVRHATRQLKEWELETLWNPDSGLFITRKNAEAAGVVDEVRDSFDARVADITEGLTDDQKLAFSRIADSTRLSVGEQSMKHQARELDRFETEELKAFVNRSQALAVENADDPARIAQEIDDQRTQIALYASNRGWGPERIRDTVEKATEETHTGVVERLLAQGRDIDAQNYFDAIEDEITDPDTKSALVASLEEGSLRGEAQKSTDQILSTTQTEAEAMEEARSISDPKLRDEVVSRVSSFWTKTNQLEAATHKDMHLRAINTIDAGGAVSDIPPHEWQQFTVTERNSIRKYHKDKNSQGEPTTNWEAYYNLKRSAAGGTAQEFMAINLLNFRHLLSDVEFKELSGLQNKIEESGTTDVSELDGFRTANQVVTDAWRELGLDATPDEGSEEAKRLALFRREVDLAVKEEQRLSNNENVDVQEVVDKMLIETVPEQKPWFARNTPVQFQFERPITISDVPDADFNAITQYLNSVGLPPSQENITEMYLEKLRLTQEAE